MSHPQPIPEPGGSAPCYWNGCWGSATTRFKDPPQTSMSAVTPEPEEETVTCASKTVLEKKGTVLEPESLPFLDVLLSLRQERHCFRARKPAFPSGATRARTHTNPLLFGAFVDCFTQSCAHVNHSGAKPRFSVKIPSAIPMVNAYPPARIPWGIFHAKPRFCTRVVDVSACTRLLCTAPHSPAACGRRQVEPQRQQHLTERRGFSPLKHCLCCSRWSRRHQPSLRSSSAAAGPPRTACSSSSSGPSTLRSSTASPPSSSWCVPAAVNTAASIRPAFENTDAPIKRLSEQSETTPAPVELPRGGLIS